MQEQVLNKLKWEIVKLSDIFEIARGGSPRPIHNYFTEEENGINWIKIGDTKNIDKYITKTKQKIKPEGIKHSRLVKEGDFILSNSMSFGRPYIMKTTGCIHDGWLLLRDKKPNLNKDFLYYLLGTQFIYNFFKRSTLGGVVENLNIELVKQIKIPLPPKEIQEQIVSLMDGAYQQKKAKEQEAKELLDNIDSYILDELGIEAPQPPKEGAVKCFTVKATEVRGGRADTNYYKSEYRELEESIKSGRFPVERLGNIVENDLIKGILPSKKQQKGKAKLLQISNISSIDGSIDCLSCLNVDESIFTKQHALEENNLVFVITGATIGKVAIWKEKKGYYLGGDLVKGKINKKNNPYYVFLYFLSQLGQKQILREITGATNGHLAPKDIKNFSIPLPPRAIQDKIANEVQARVNKAKTLKSEAQELLAKAKQEVERVILGE